MWSVHTTEYYTAMKRQRNPDPGYSSPCPGPRGSCHPWASEPLGREDITSSEMSQTRGRSCDSTHARASSQIHRDRKGWGPGAGEDGE